MQGYSNHFLDFLRSWIRALVHERARTRVGRVPPRRAGSFADALAPPSGHLNAIDNFEFDMVIGNYILYLKSKTFNGSSQFLNGNFNFEMVIPIFDKI